MVFTVIAKSDEGIEFFRSCKVRAWKECIVQKLSVMLVQRYGNFGWQCHQRGVRLRLSKSPLGRFSNKSSAAAGVGGGTAIDGLLLSATT